MSRATNAGVPSVEEKEQSHNDKRHRHVCPECGQERVYRSRRRTLSDYFLALTGQYPYRCHECDHRFHARRRRRTPRSRWASCPRCNTTELDRIAGRKVPTTWGNLLWRLLQVSAYRCPGCRKCFFAIRSLRPKEAERS